MLFTNYGSSDYTLVAVPGSIVHSIPVAGWWLTACGGSESEAERAKGLTYTYDSSGTYLGPGFYGDNSTEISYALVYYNPDASTYHDPGRAFTAQDYRCLVAHEVRHCFSMMHATTGDAIMWEEHTSFSGLQEADITAFKSRYGQ